MQNQENHMSSEQLSGTFSETQPILKRSILETSILRLLESVGQSCRGQATLNAIKTLQSLPSIGTTLTVSCARNSDMGPIMEVDLKLYRPKQSCRSISFEDFSLSI